MRRAHTGRDSPRRRGRGADRSIDRRALMVAIAVVEHITRRAQWESAHYPLGSNHSSGEYAQFDCGCEHEIREDIPIDEGWLLCSFHQGMEEVSHGADLEDGPVQGSAG